MSKLSGSGSSLVGYQVTCLVNDAIDLCIFMENSNYFITQSLKQTIRQLGHKLN